MRSDLSIDLGRYRVRWPDRHVIFDFDLLRSERSGEVVGEVTVTAWDDATAIMRHLHQARVTLTGTRSREDLGRKLKATANGSLADIAWAELVEGSCVLVLRAYREGEPAIALREAERPAGDMAIIPPLVLHRQPTIWFGDGGSGKSILALAAALSIHADLDLLGARPTSTHRVAYLDFELEAWEQRDRMRQLVGDDMPDLVYRRCAGALRDQVDSLRRMVRDKSIGFVVIDSVGPACGGPPEESGVALAFFEAVRMLGVGALLIAHVNRAGDTDKPFGSAFWHNAARATWHVRRQQEVDADRITVAFVNRKANLGPLARPIGFDVHFGDRVRISRTDLAGLPEFASLVPIKVRMANELRRSGALTLHDIADTIAADVEAVRLAAKRGEGKTFVRVEGPDGITRWGLLADRPTSVGNGSND